MDTQSKGEGKQGPKQRLFWAGLRVFAAKGYKGATVRDICREAGGANLNAINYYFGGKKKLYQTILDVLFTEGARQIQDRLDAEGQIPAERQLRIVLEVSCRMFFDAGEIGAAFMRLWLMELANPTPFLGDMVERHSGPQVEAVLAMIDGVVGPGAPREVLVDCMMHILGPAVYRALVWPAMHPLFAGHRPMTAYWPELVDKLYRFSMAGLAAVREDLKEHDHAT